MGIYPLPFEGSRDQGQLITVDRAGLVLLWSLKLDQARQLLKLPFEPEIISVLPERLLLFAYSSKHGLKLYSLSKLVEIASRGPTKTKLTTADFEPSGQSILIGGADGRVYRWNYFEDTPKDKMFGGQVLNQDRTWEAYFGHGAVVSAVTYHPFSRIFFSGDWRGQLRARLSYTADEQQAAYDKNLFGPRFFASDSPAMVAGGDGNRIDYLRASSDGELLVLANEIGQIQLWTVRGFKKVAEFQAHQGVVFDLAIETSGELIASVGRDGNLKVLRIQKTQEEGMSANYSLLEEKQIQLPNVRKISFYGGSKIFAGDITGKIYEILIKGV